MRTIDNTELLTKTGNSQKIEHLLSDLQGNTLKSHGRPNVRLNFLQFNGTAEETADWLQSLSGKLTSMRSQISWSDERSQRIDKGEDKLDVDNSDPGFFSISLSAIGYKKLSNIPVPNGARFDSDFKVAKDPQKETWESPFQTEIHGIVILAKSVDAKLKVMQSEFLNGLPSHISIIHTEVGKGLKNDAGLDIEHFGFVDGRSQPRYFKEDLASKEPTTNIWDPSAFLKMVLAEDPNGKSFSGVDDNVSTDLNGDHGYGSYLVFRKLEQDKEGWDRAVVRVANNHPSRNPNLIGAYAVGRFKDGTLVAASDEALGEKNPANDFVFITDEGLDPNGSKCPFHAHIRKTNPRGESLGKITFDRDKVRLTRRGIPYGNREDKEKGLLFMCYQSNIKEQFEFMQESWADDPKFRHPNTQVDSVIGQGVSNPEWPIAHGQTESTRLEFGNFVTLKGAAYFFTPSISFIESLPKLNTEIPDKPIKSLVPRWFWILVGVGVLALLFFILK